MKKEFPISEKNNWSSEQEEIKQKAERAKKVLITGLVDATVRALNDDADLSNPLRVKGLIAELRPVIEQIKGHGSDWATVRHEIQEKAYREVETRCQSASQYEKAHRIYESLADELFGKVARISEEDGGQERME
ncbi:MAG: hypothetical protein KBC26_00890 [Candidatus Pacebacteria bacterium]|nr:hypothetical protein [Candidatus Paceibacterota bacterium]